MRKNTIFLLIVLLVSSVAIAQKNELKSAEKALKKGDTEGAKTALQSAEALIANANDKYKAQYHYLKGKLYLDMVKKGINTFESIDKASEAFNALIAIEASGKKKYTDEVRTMQSEGANVILQAAQGKYKEKDYKAAAKGFEKVYRISATDTVFLYNAAVVATVGKDYDSALKYYQELKENKYTGVETQYVATNKETQKEEQMGSKQERDFMVKAGTHTNPKDKKTESKRAEIVKNIALIYVEQGKNDEALKAFADARAENPDDINLILNEANIYVTLGNNEKFKELMTEAAAKDPDNPDLHYNIGVVTMQEKQYEAARESYKKALSINPKYINAILNLSTTYINEGNALIEEMNKLGNSRADVKKYDELKIKKDDLFKQGAKILEDALKDNPGDQSILEQLKNIYGALGDNDNYMRVKKMLE
ncbi:MAG: tetratricopeptide repeat protein [Bacteroidota bacterium]